MSVNNIFVRRLSWLLSLSSVIVFGNVLSAQAETMDKVSTDMLAEPVANLSEVSPNDIGTAPLSPQTETTTQTTVDVAEAQVVDASATRSTAPADATQRSLQQDVPAATESNPAQLDNGTEPPLLEQTTPTNAAASSTPAPVPGTTATSSAPLTTQSPLTPQEAPASAPTAPRVAQTNINPGQPTRGGSSYVGIAGNFGLTGDSELGSTNFTVISKIGLTNSISVRPSVIIADGAVFLIPLTYDLSFAPINAFERAIPLSPFLGAGVAISTGDGSDVGPMLTAGLDVPLTRQFTATAAVNVGFLESTDVGVVVGVGYNFSGLLGL